MTKPSSPIFAQADVIVEPRADGTILLRNALQAEPACGSTLMQSLRTWAHRSPDTVFLAERAGDRWAEMTFGDALERVLVLSRRLATLDLSAERPLLLMAENGIDHAVAVLAATRIGVPVGVLAPAYAASGAHGGKIEGALALLTPGAIILGSADYVSAFHAAGTDPDILLSFAPCRGARALSELALADEVAADALEAAVGPDTIAKFLFTSGSTGAPKAVVNTQRMLTSNMDALSTIWPFVKIDPPRLVDWLPWSHTFGGNVCFNLALCFGGSLYIDDGRPTPALLDRTVRNIKAVRPNVYFSVPQGLDALTGLIERDRDLAVLLLSETAFVFTGGAALPQQTRDRLKAAATAHGLGMPSIIGGWGTTETAPAASVAYFDTPHAGNLGVPLPGVTLKMEPIDDYFALSVKGPNVLREYWRRPDATADAFDAEGFFISGDAGRFVSPSRPNEGVLFCGRTAENFKLRSGTWVNAGAVRLAAIDAGSPLISDAVVCGQDEAEIGLLLVPQMRACRESLSEVAAGLSDQQVLDNPQLVENVRQSLERYNRAQIGSSTRIGRFAFLDGRPDPVEGEITEKGYLNQRRIQRRRADEVLRLFAAGTSVGQSRTG